MTEQCPPLIGLSRLRLCEKARPKHASLSNVDALESIEQDPGPQSSLDVPFKSARQGLARAMACDDVEDYRQQKGGVRAYVVQCVNIRV